MPTVRQKKLAKAVIENTQLDNPKPAGQVLKSVGYGTGLQNQPKRVLESEGFKEALEDYGFSEENARKVVASILLDEKKDANARLKASDMVFKVHGSYAPDKRLNVNVEVEANPELKELTHKLNELYRGSSGRSDGGITGPMGGEAQDQE